MKNKKAQLGDIIANFYVFLFIVVIMGLFVFLSTGIALIKKPKPVESAPFSFQEDDLLLKTITLKFPESKLPEENVFVDKELLVFDAYVLFENSRENFLRFYAELEDQLRKLLDEENKKECIILAKGAITHPAGDIRKGEFSDDFYLCVINGEYHSASRFEANMYRFRDNFIKNLAEQYRYDGMLKSISFENSRNKIKYVEYGYGAYNLEK